MSGRMIPKSGKRFSDKIMPGGITMTDQIAAARELTYDLFLTTGGKRFYFRNTDRGVTLTDWRIAWTADGKTDSAPLETIASVRLQCGGDWKNPLNQCRISFADGRLLTVTDGNQFGTADAAQTPVYRDFVRALHARLALAPSGAITFIQGYPETNYRVVKVAASLLGLISVVGPLILWIMVGKMEVFFLLIGGIGLCWPMIKMVQNNAPRPYDPRQLPEELME
jgi:hypothetical protein